MTEPLMRLKDRFFKLSNKYHFLLFRLFLLVIEIYFSKRRGILIENGPEEIPCVLQTNILSFHSKIYGF